MPNHDFPLNINGKKFRSVTNVTNGEVDENTVFHYIQNGERISAEYSGGAILEGHLIGKMLPNGQLQFSYHHLNEDMNVMAGQCLSSPTILSDGRIRFSEKWQWLTGDRSKGISTIEET